MNTSGSENKQVSVVTTPAMDNTVPKSFVVTIVKPDGTKYLLWA